MPSYQEYLDALGQRESGKDYQAVNQYGFLGKYQMGEAALIDAGYYQKDGTKINDFSGAWTGKNGINSKEDFLNNPQAQEDAIRSYNQRQWQTIRANDLDLYVGLTIGGVEITESGLLAGAHLLGVGNLKRFLESNGQFVPKDGNNVPITDYIKRFNGYDISLNIPDPNSPNSESQDAVLIAPNGSIEEAITILDASGKIVSVDTTITQLNGSSIEDLVAFAANHAILNEQIIETPVNGFVRATVSGQGANVNLNNAQITVQPGTQANINGDGSYILGLPNSTVQTTTFPTTLVTSMTNSTLVATTGMQLTNLGSNNNLVLGPNTTLSNLGNNNTIIGPVPPNTTDSGIGNTSIESENLPLGTTVALSSSMGFSASIDEDDVVHVSAGGE